MSAFVILFLFALLSFAIRTVLPAKLFALAGLGIAAYLSYLGFSTPLTGFESTDSIRFFEIIIFIVLGAIVLNEEESINITQSLFIAAASTLLLESNTLLTFVLSFEALSIISFVLVSHINGAKKAEGAIKMFIAGAIATALIFLGLTFYTLDGHNINAALQMPVSLFGNIGLWLIIAGLFYKLTIVPMHSWAADTYANVKPSHAAILSGVAKTVVAVAFFRVFESYFISSYDFSNTILIVLAVTTMTLGNFLALFQKRVGKILAYSSIAQAGYILLAFVAVKSAYASVGILYIAIAYVFMQSAVFLVVDKLSDTDNNLTLEDLKGLYTYDRKAAFFFSVQLFSLAGIPLLAGFLGKTIVFYAVVDSGFYIVALIALLNSALSVGYYAWIVKHLYFDEQMQTNSLKLNTSATMAQLILLAGTLYFGVFAYSIFSVV